MTYETKTETCGNDKKMRERMDPNKQASSTSAEITTTRKEGAHLWGDGTLIVEGGNETMIGFRTVRVRTVRVKTVRVRTVRARVRVRVRTVRVRTFRVRVKTVRVRTVRVRVRKVGLGLLGLGNRVRTLLQVRVYSILGR